MQSSWFHARVYIIDHNEYTIKQGNNKVITTSFHKKNITDYHKSHILKISQIPYFSSLFIHKKNKKTSKNLNNQKNRKPKALFTSQGGSPGGALPSPVQQSPLPLRRGLAPPRGGSWTMDQNPGWVRLVSTHLKKYAQPSKMGWKSSPKFLGVKIRKIWRSWNHHRVVDWLVVLLNGWFIEYRDP